MKRTLVAFFVAALVATACGVKNPLTGSDSGMKTVSSLWSDVPKMDGLSSSELEMPLTVKLLMRTALNQIGGRGGKDTGDWIVFQTTRTADDVTTFYSNDRMAANGWDKSDKSTCLKGSELGFPQAGTVCLFSKSAGGKDIALMILPAQGEKAGQVNVFFLRVEVTRDNEPKVAKSVPNKPDDGKNMTNGPAPYGIDQRPMPAGIQLAQLLPVQVGAYTREGIRLATAQNLKLEEIQKAMEVEGASIYADYRAGNATIFVELGINHSVGDAREALETAAGDAAGGVFPTDPRFGARGREPSYLKVLDDNGAFFAWTRGNYFFSAHAKTGEAALDAFMQAFPY